MSNAQSILLPLADGFEEIEAVTVIDVLRRAGIKVLVVDLGESGRSDTGGHGGAHLVRGAHGIELATDRTIDDVDLDEIEAVVLPGGLPGATNLRDDVRVLAACKHMADRGRWIGAICAAPIVLAEAGLLDGKRATSYPAFRDQLAGAEVVTDEKVVVSGRVMTSSGPGTAIDFALSLVAVLSGPELAVEIADAMLVEGFAERAGLASA
ncbi:MAG: DJ-1/PfpI family protein [Planctomycetota bacterium]|nr:DJ-1/PfpI family protein [Planctomycetota bacterium]